MALLAYRSQNLGVVVIYHPGTPQDTSGTALDSPGQLVGGLDTSCNCSSFFILLFYGANHIEPGCVQFETSSLD